MRLVVSRTVLDSQTEELPPQFYRTSNKVFVLGFKKKTVEEELYGVEVCLYCESNPIGPSCFRIVKSPEIEQSFCSLECLQKFREEDHDV